MRRVETPLEEVPVRDVWYPASNVERTMPGDETPVLERTARLGSDEIAEAGVASVATRVGAAISPPRTATATRLRERFIRISSSFAGLLPPGREIRTGGIRGDRTRPVTASQRVAVPLRALGALSRVGTPADLSRRAVSRYARRVGPSSRHPEVQW